MDGKGRKTRVKKEGEGEVGGKERGREKEVLSERGEKRHPRGGIGGEKVRERVLRKQTKWMREGREIGML